MNTFPFVLPHYPPAFALVILFAIAVLFTDRMWRLLPGSSPVSFNFTASPPIPT